MPVPRKRAMHPRSGPALQASPSWEAGRAGSTPPSRPFEYLEEAVASPMGRKPFLTYTADQGGS